MPEAGRLTWSLRWRLSLLWFLEWGITGALMTYLPILWDKIHIPKSEQGQLMAMTAVGLWVAPFVVGQVVDRWVAAEKYLAFSHFLGGLSLYWLASAADAYTPTGGNLPILMALCGLFAVAYFPTVPLTTALCFRHLPQPEAQFGKVRVWGTVGWMVSGLVLSVWLARDELLQMLHAEFPVTIWPSRIELWLKQLPIAVPTDCFRMSALLSFSLSSFCIFLPHTPPLKAPRGEGRFAPLAVLGMLRNRSFLIFLVISFLLAVLVVPLYSLAVPNLLGKLLEDRHYSKDWVPAVMLAGQISEFPALLLLSVCLRKWGLKFTFSVGIAAWAVRLGIFAAADQFWPVMSGVVLHGICHVFLIIVAQLFIDAQCRQDLRVSAQNLLSFVTVGIGMPLGAVLGGFLYELFEAREHRLLLFAFPTLAAVVLLLAFWKFVEIPVSAGREVLESPASKLPTSPSAGGHAAS
jgi:hypothetical protein